MKINELTTRDVIQLLPIGEELRDRLLALYPDNVSYDRGVQIEEITWDLFYEYYEMLYQAKLRKMIEDNPGPLPEGYRDTLLAEVEDTIVQEHTSHQTNSDLAQIRHKLETMVPEI